MERIVIEVDDNIAQKWKFIDNANKQTLSQQISKILGVALVKHDDNIWNFLQGLRTRAEAKGFTDEILNEILDEK